MRFTKMQALGNDFILIDSRKEAPTDPSPLAIRLCNRRFGIGADQMIVLGPSESADFGMRVFNADGSEVEMCGNGIRCLARYVWDHGLSDKDVLSIETLAGIIRPQRHQGMVRVDMGRPVLDGPRIPVRLEGRVVDHPLEVDGERFALTCLSMGNPHAVVFVEDAEGFPVGRFGPLIETNPLFPNRTNVEFVSVLNGSEIRMRVWERGTGQTMACGTGASASAVASAIKGLTGRKVTVHLDGGDLLIEWAEDDRVYMTGPAVEVFEGNINLNQGGRDVYRLNDTDRNPVQEREG